MIAKEHLEEDFIGDKDFIEDDWNSEYDPLADIKLITVMYLDVIFNSPSIMYKKEARCVSTMIVRGLL